MNRSKKEVSIVGIAIVLLTAGSVSLARYSGGIGEPNDPYRIATPNDLNDIGNHVEDFNKCFVMVNDINLSQYTGTQFNIIGETDGWYSSNAFHGVFDGNGHTISNFTYTCSGVEYVGLFVALGVSLGEVPGQIKNLSLKDPNIHAELASVVGLLVGRFASGLISDCSVSGGTLSGDKDPDGLFCHVGGLVGRSDGAVSNCHVSCTIEWDASVNMLGFVGGLIGTNFGNDMQASPGFVEDCSSEGIVWGLNCEGGGLVGWNVDATISRCYSSSTVWADYQVGGLIGSNNSDDRVARISDCYALTSVSGETSTYAIGGLVGYNWDGVLENCYAAGSVSTEPNAGGLVGEDNGGSYSACFWNNTVNPDVNGISNTTNPNLIGKTTSEMQTENTFTDAGWDLVEIWGIGEGQTYPFLRKYSAGDLNHDGIVDWRDFAIFALHWLEGGEI